MRTLHTSARPVSRQGTIVFDPRVPATPRVPLRCVRYYDAKIRFRSTKTLCRAGSGVAHSGGLCTLDRSKGRRISARWLKVQMKKQVKELYTCNEAESACFRASRGWFTAFIRRYKIALRKKSNSKGQSVVERLPGIQQWHARLRHRLRRGKQVSKKWGRWLPECRYNVDRVPFTLADGDKRTCNDVGEKCIWISGSKKGDDKREATLQLCVRLSNTQQQP